MPADSLDPSELKQYVVNAKAAWRKHAQSLTWEEKEAAIERMRERDSALKVAREKIAAEQHATLAKLP